MATNLERMLARTRAGEIDFAQFVSGTRTEFHAMACYLMRRWKTPEWFTVEDVEQELYLEAWRFIWKFDPTLGVSFSRYIIWNAMAAAKREMHRARGVSTHGSPDKRASCFEANLSSFGLDGEGEALMATLLAEPARAEDELAQIEATRHAATEALRACTTAKERTAVLAIREAGSVDGAWRVLYDDIDHRIALRLGSEEIADRFVRKHASAVAHRVAENSRVRSI